MRLRLPLWSVVAGLALVAGCSYGGEERATAIVRIAAARGPLTIDAELARTPAQRERGLMGRATLGAEEGMLFLYPSPRLPDDGFWMYRTQFPLDIAFIDSERRIVALLAMAPCPSRDPARCPVYRPGVGYQFALEMNAGWFAGHGVAVGDRVEWLPAER